MARAGFRSHGESRMRLLRIIRRGDRHDPRDLTLSVRLDGDHDPPSGDPPGAAILPREILRALVHSAVRQHGAEGLEVLGVGLCRAVLDAHPGVVRVRVELAEQPWARAHVGGKAHGQSFVLGGPEQRTAAVTHDRRRAAIVSGIDQLVLMRTAGFLAPSTERPDDGTLDGVPALVAGSLSARWTYMDPQVTFDSYRAGVRAALVETFAVHAERSLHDTLQAMAEVILETYAEIREVTLAIRERPYRPADLFRAAADGPEDLFVAADEPLGIVEVTLERLAPG